MVRARVIVVLVVITHEAHVRSATARDKSRRCNPKQIEMMTPTFLTPLYNQGMAFQRAD